MITNLQDARRLYFHLERKDKKDDADKLIEHLLLAAKKNDPAGDWWSDEAVASRPLETLFKIQEPNVEMELLTKLKWLLQGKQFDMFKNMEELQFEEAFASSEDDEEDFLAFAREKGYFDLVHLNHHVKKTDYVQHYRRQIIMNFYDRAPPDKKRKQTVDDFEAKMAKIDTSKKSNRQKIRKLEEEYLKSI